MSDRSVSISSPSLVPAKSVAPSAAARTKLMMEGPILPTLLRLSAPNVLNLLAFVGMITFDGFFLGRIGTTALAGASLAFPFVMLSLQATNSGMGNGVSSAIARALGAGKRDRADALVFHAVLLALGLGATFRCVPVRRPFAVSRDGRPGRHACGRARLCERGARRRRLHLRAQFPRERRARYRQHDAACIRAGRLRSRPHRTVAVLIFGAGPVPALGPAGAAWGLVRRSRSAALVSSVTCARDGHRSSSTFAA